MFIQFNTQQQDLNHYTFDSLYHDLHFHIASYLTTSHDLNNYFFISKSFKVLKYEDEAFRYYKILANLFQINLGRIYSPKEEIESYIKIHQQGGKLFRWLARSMGPSAFKKTELIPPDFIDEIWKKLCFNDPKKQFSIQYLHSYLSTLKHKSPIYRAELPNKVQFLAFNFLFLKDAGLYKMNHIELVCVYENNESDKKFGLYISNYFNYKPEMDYFSKLACGLTCKNFERATEDGNYFVSIDCNFDMNQEPESCVKLLSAMESK